MSISTISPGDFSLKSLIYEKISAFAEDYYLQKIVSQ